MDIEKKTIEEFEEMIKDCDDNGCEYYEWVKDPEMMEKSFKDFLRTALTQAKEEEQNRIVEMIEEERDTPRNFGNFTNHIYDDIINNLKENDTNTN